MGGLARKSETWKVRNPCVASGSCCHIYNRGVDKRPIFLDDDDYKRFLAHLRLANGTTSTPVSHFLMRNNIDLQSVTQEELGEPLVHVGAFCLMPNHFHLILKSAVPGGISKYMQRVETGYTMYFNKKNDRSGCLFQGHFKDKVADDPAYLRTLFSYVHRNPVAEIPLPPASQIEASIAYPYSSAKELLSENRFITSSEGFPKIFEDADDFRASLAPQSARSNLGFLQGPTLR